MDKNTEVLLDLSILIKKSLDYYDVQNDTYKYISALSSTIDRENNTIHFPDIDEKYKYEILGFFDNSTQIWMWAWMSPDFLSNETIIVKKLLNYGLKINPTTIKPLSPDKLYLKTQLVNSRFLLEDEIQLDLHLAIASYLAKDNFKFIFNKKKYLNKNNTKYITVYYLII